MKRKSRYTLFSQCPKALWLPKDTLHIARGGPICSRSSPQLLQTRYLGNGESVAGIERRDSVI